MRRSADTFRHIRHSDVTDYSYMVCIVHSMATPEELYSHAPSMIADCRRAPILAEMAGENGVRLTTQHIKLLQPRSSNRGETPVLLPLGF